MGLVARAVVKVTIEDIFVAQAAKRCCSFNVRYHFSIIKGTQLMSATNRSGHARAPELITSIQ